MEAERNTGNRIWGKTLTAVVIVLLTAVTAVTVLFGYNRFTLALMPVGETEIVMDYGTPYQESGAQLSFSGSRFWREGFVPDVQIVTAGTVDTGKTGTYTVTYSADFLWWHADAQRVIRVVDRKAPDIVLNGTAEVYVLPGSQYSEAGYVASDEYDGDITDRVEQITLDDSIVYRVSDDAGNVTQVSRRIHYNDDVPPEITLTNGLSIQIYGGTAFTDPGYGAWDNVDGDITDRVQREGDVNIYFCGPYELTYSVTDSFGNTAAVSRTVEVVPSPRPEEITPEGKVIYLTFDDGPGPYTRELLEILEKYGVKATFFVVCNKYADVIGEIAAAGHSVGIHTACHDYRTIYASEEAYFADLLQVRELIYEQTGVETTLLRFPGGSSNKASYFNKGIMTRLTEQVQDAGFQYFDWNVDSMDAGGAKTSREVYKNVVNGVSRRRVSIVLQHDIKGYSVDAVERIIKWGLDNGYAFLALEPTSPCFHHNVNN